MYIEPMLLMRWHRYISHLGQLSLLVSVKWEVNTGEWKCNVFFGWEGNCRSVFTLAMHHTRFDMSAYWPVA